MLGSQNGLQRANPFDLSRAVDRQQVGAKRRSEHWDSLFINRERIPLNSEYKLMAGLPWAYIKEI